jgi:hypothetical protein
MFCIETNCCVRLLPFSSKQHYRSVFLIDASKCLLLCVSETLTSLLLAKGTTALSACFAVFSSTSLYVHQINARQCRLKIARARKKDHEWQSRTFTAMRPAAKGQLNLWGDG